MSKDLLGVDYREVVLQDLRFMRSIQKFLYNNPKIENFMRQIISKNPFNDICVVFALL